MRPPGAGWLVAALLLPAAAAAELVFRVPEVLVRHAAAPRPVGTGGGAVNSSGTAGVEAKADHLTLRYEEYFVEHEVSTVDARKAARKINLDEVSAPVPGCGSCSRRELEYCETRVLADHCCCERAFMPEPLPWLPHTCYAGAARCRPLAHDCAAYARLRDCCCKANLAKKWKALLGGSARFAPLGAALAALAALALIL